MGSARVYVGFVLGLVLAACAARKAEDACEEYLAAAEDCAAINVSISDIDCGRVKGKDLDRYECLAAWAQDGCDASELAECTAE